MEENDEEVSLTCTQQRKSSIPGLSLYQSTQNGLNQGSEQTLYQSVRNTLYEDAISMNSMHSAVSLDNLQPSDDSSTINNDTNETVIDNSCIDRRNSIHNSRLVITNIFIFYNLYIKCHLLFIDYYLKYNYILFMAISNLITYIKLLIINSIITIGN